MKTIDDAGYVVVDFDRVIVNPEQTEFNTKAFSEGQQQLLQYCQSANAESATYQFVARIVPRPTDGPYVSEAIVTEMIDTVEKLKHQVRTEREHSVASKAN